MFLRTILVLFCFYSGIKSIRAQLRLVDNKGTLQHVDTSKWQYAGLDIFNKNSGKVGIGTSMPAASLHVAGTALYGTLQLSDFPTDAVIGSASATVDKYTSINIQQFTGNVSLTLPSPTNNTAGRLLYISNSGNIPVTVQNVILTVNSTSPFVWNGSAWSRAVPPIITLPFSSLSAATATNTIDNLDHSQAWNWSTATSQQVLSVDANSLTTGNLLSLVSTNTGTTGSLLTIHSASTGNVSNGLVNFKFSGAHSGNGFTIEDLTASGKVVHIKADNITDGTGVKITSSSPGISSGTLLEVNGNVTSATSKGLLQVINNQVSSTGTVAAIQSNSLPGSGLTILANGDIGVGTSLPNATLHLNGSMSASIVRVSASTYVVSPTDFAIHLINGSTVTITLPSVATSVGRILYIINNNTGNATITPSFRASRTQPASTTIGLNSRYMLMNDGTDWVRVL